MLLPATSVALLRPAVQLYNEDINDLLAPENQKLQASPAALLRDCMCALTDVASQAAGMATEDSIVRFQAAASSSVLPLARCRCMRQRRRACTWQGCARISCRAPTRWARGLPVWALL